MISDVDMPTAQPPAAEPPTQRPRFRRRPAPPADAVPAGFAPPPRRLPAVLAALAGCLLLVVATSPYYPGGVPSFLSPTYDGYNGYSGSPLTLQTWLSLAVPVLATAIGLSLLRWWPHLLAAAALLLVPGVVSEANLASFPSAVYLLPLAGYYLAILALLACAQGLLRTAAGWAAAIAALTVGARVVGSAFAGGLTFVQSPYAVGTWHFALLAVALAGIVPAVRQHRRGDADAVGACAAEGSSGSVGSSVTVGPRARPRVRLVLAGVLAAAVPIPLTFLTSQNLADVLGVSTSALVRHNYAQTAVIGVFALVAVTLLAALAGRWSLAGALTAALIQVVVTAPVVLAVNALDFDDPVRRLAAVAGAVLGAVVVGNRWRFHSAAALSVLAATALLIAYAATTGDPEKLAEQHTVIPAVLILVLCTAAVGAVVGATAPVLGRRGALPVVLGPLAAVLAAGGLQTLQAAYGLSYQSELVQSTITTSAVLLPVAGAAVGGLGFAQLLATRRAERKQAEQIRREAAAAERDRLARPIHDGVLQVLALVQRHGSELGGHGGELAALAGEQEVALRSLLAGRTGAGRDTAEDLRAPLHALATPAVEVATPAQPVPLPAGAAAEVVAAVKAALDNVIRHAGPDARAWVLLEDEQDGVRVSVRDDGVGFPPQRPAEAAEAGRLGITQSMRGRIADLGGTTTLESRPGEGTEVEFWVPRQPRRPSAGH